MEKTAAIKLSEVEYFYRSHWTGRKRPALKNISLEVKPGESFGFLGLNGAGKTTTIKAILGLIPLDGGEIEIFGQSSRLTASRRSVGYLPEQPYFYDYLSVEEILRMYAACSDVPRSRISERVDSVLERVGMKDRRSSRMRLLSKGLTQRVALAQAIIASPRLLILDEPFSGLDPIGRKEFREIFSDLKQGGTTIFMSSHILSDVEFLCDRVSILTKGTLQGVFDIDHISESISGSYELVTKSVELPPELAGASKRVGLGRFVRWEYSDRQVAEKALRYHLERGEHIEHYGFARGGLEEFFLEIVARGEK